MPFNARLFEEQRARKKNTHGEKKTIAAKKRKRKNFYLKVLQANAEASQDRSKSIGYCAGMGINDAVVDSGTLACKSCNKAGHRDARSSTCDNNKRNRDKKQRAIAMGAEAEVDVKEEIVEVNVQEEILEVNDRLSWNDSMTVECLVEMNAVEKNTTESDESGAGESSSSESEAEAEESKKSNIL